MKYIPLTKQSWCGVSPPHCPKVMSNLPRRSSQKICRRCQILVRAGLEIVCKLVGKDMSIDYILVVERL